MDNIQEVVGDSLGFQIYFADKGFSGITTNDMDKIIERHGTNVFGWKDFMQIYLAKKAEENTVVMKKWTVWVGRMTFAVMAMTIIQVIIGIIQCLK